MDNKRAGKFSALQDCMKPWQGNDKDLMGHAAIHNAKMEKKRVLRSKSQIEGKQWLLEIALNRPECMSLRLI